LQTLALNKVLASVATKYANLTKNQSAQIKSVAEYILLSSRIQACPEGTIIPSPPVTPEPMPEPVPEPSPIPEPKPDPTPDPIPFPESPAPIEPNKNPETPSAPAAPLPPEETPPINEGKPDETDAETPVVSEPRQNQPKAPVAGEPLPPTSDQIELPRSYLI